MSKEMGFSSEPTVSRVRLIWAIVAKDFVDSLKNRKMLTNVIVVVFLIVFYRFLPVLGSANDPARVFLYDAGASSIVRELERSDALRLRSVESYDEMLRQVGSENVRTIGLVLPADFDQQLNADEDVELEAIIDHWVSDEDEASMRAEVEAELARLTSTSVELSVGRETITQADGAFGFVISLGLLVVMGMMGMMHTPQLMVEEKEGRTIDALKVSPATMTDMLIAKGLVGGAYSLLMSVAVLVAYGHLVQHWWAMIGAMLAGAFFYVAIGLILGLQLKDTRQVSLWGFIIFQPIIITTILGLFEAIPEGIRNTMRWFPTVAMGNAASQSITAAVDLGAYFLSLFIMVAWGALFFGLNAWLVKRLEK
jgi:ABC-2 type transport system permease protein